VGKKEEIAAPKETKPEPEFVLERKLSLFLQQNPKLNLKPNLNLSLKR